MSGEDSLAVVIDLYLPDALHTRAFQAQVQAANASKQTAEPHALLFPIALLRLSVAYSTPSLYSK
jgi:hypothetical protein